VLKISCKISNRTPFKELSCSSNCMYVLHYVHTLWSLSESDIASFVFPQVPFFDDVIVGTFLTSPCALYSLFLQCSKVSYIPLHSVLLSVIAYNYLHHERIYYKYFLLWFSPCCFHFITVPYKHLPILCVAMVIAVHFWRSFMHAQPKTFCLVTGVACRRMENFVCVPDFIPTIIYTVT